MSLSCSVCSLRLPRRAQSSFLLSNDPSDHTQVWSRLSRKAGRLPCETFVDQVWVQREDGEHEDKIIIHRLCQSLQHREWHVLLPAVKSQSKNLGCRPTLREFTDAGVVDSSNLMHGRAPDCCLYITRVFIRLDRSMAVDIVAWEDGLCGGVVRANREIDNIGRQEQQSPTTDWLSDKEDTGVPAAYAIAVALIASDSAKWDGLFGLSSKTIPPYLFSRSAFPLCSFHPPSVELEDCLADSGRTLRLAGRLRPSKWSTVPGMRALSEIAETLRKLGKEHRAQISSLDLSMNELVTIDLVLHLPSIVSLLPSLLRMSFAGTLISPGGAMRPLLRLVAQWIDNARVKQDIKFDFVNTPFASCHNKHWLLDQYGIKNNVSLLEKCVSEETSSSMGMGKRYDGQSVPVRVAAYQWWKCQPFYHACADSPEMLERLLRRVQAEETLNEEQKAFVSASALGRVGKILLEKGIKARLSSSISISTPLFVENLSKTKIKMSDEDVITEKEPKKDVEGVLEKGLEYLRRAVGNPRAKVLLAQYEYNQDKLGLSKMKVKEALFEIVDRACDTRGGWLDCESRELLIAKGETHILLSSIAGADEDAAWDRLRLAMQTLYSDKAAKIIADALSFHTAADCQSLFEAFRIAADLGDSYSLYRVAMLLKEPRIGNLVDACLRSPEGYSFRGKELSYMYLRIARDNGSHDAAYELYSYLLAAEVARDHPRSLGTWGRRRMSSDGLLALIGGSSSHHQHPRYWFLCGVLYELMGAHDTAMQWMAVACDLQSPEANHYLGLSSTSKRSAQEFFNQAVRFGFSESYYFLAKTGGEEGGFDTDRLLEGAKKGSWRCTIQLCENFLNYSNNKKPWLVSQEELCDLVTSLKDRASYDVEYWELTVILIRLKIFSLLHGTEKSKDIEKEEREDEDRDEDDDEDDDDDDEEEEEEEAMSDLVDTLWIAADERSISALRSLEDIYRSKNVGLAREFGSCAKEASESKITVVDPLGQPIDLERLQKRANEAEELPGVAEKDDQKNKIRVDMDASRRFAGSEPAALAKGAQIELKNHDWGCSSTVCAEEIGRLRSTVQTLRAENRELAFNRTAGQFLYEDDAAMQELLASFCELLPSGTCRSRRVMGASHKGIYSYL